jgi:hypothetical protein
MLAVPVFPSRSRSGERLRPARGDLEFEQLETVLAFSAFSTGRVLAMSDRPELRCSLDEVLARP